jgi:hypothetical protein
VAPAAGRRAPPRSTVEYAVAAAMSSALSLALARPWPLLRFCLPDLLARCTMSLLFPACPLQCVHSLGCFAAVISHVAGRWVVIGYVPISKI